MKNEQIEIVTLKYPFDIKNLKPKMNGIYASSEEQATYNVKLFGAVKYEVTQLIKRLKVGRENYQHVVYAWRSTSKLPAGSTLVGQLKFISQINETTNTIHVNIELLPLVENELKLCPRNTPIEDDDDDDEDEDEDDDDEDDPIAESVLRFAKATLPNQEHNLVDIKKVVDLFDVPGLIEFVRELRSLGDSRSDENAEKVVDYMTRKLPADHHFSTQDYDYINMMLVILAPAIKGDTQEPVE